MIEATNIVDITPENFQQVIIEQSQQNLVVIGFWTARDPSCIELMNNIAQRVTGLEGVIFAKIDVDSQAQIAMQFGIQSVPTVALFRDSRPVDSFMGMKQPEELEQFFAPHFPNEQDGLIQQAAELFAAGDFAQAYSVALQAHQLDVDHLDAKLSLVQVAIQIGKLDQAEQLLQTIGMVDQDSDYHNLQSALQLARSAAESPEILALEQQLVDQPDNNEVKVQLAVQLSQANRHQEALELLYQVLRQDLNFGDAKKQYLDVLATLPANDPMAAKYRRMLYSMMY